MAPARGAERPRILVIKLAALGDFVQAFGPFAAIRAHHPDAAITLLTTPPYADLARRSPWFDAVWSDGRPSWRDAAGWWRLARRLRGAGFARVYDLQTSRRSSRYRALVGPRAEWSGVAPRRQPSARQPAAKRDAHGGAAARATGDGRHRPLPAAGDGLAGRRPRRLRPAAALRPAGARRLARTPRQALARGALRRARRRPRPAGRGCRRRVGEAARRRGRGARAERAGPHRPHRFRRARRARPPRRLRGGQRHRAGPPHRRGGLPDARRCSAPKATRRSAPRAGRRWRCCGTSGWRRWAWRRCGRRWRGLSRPSFGLDAPARGSPWSAPSPPPRARHAKDARPCPPSPCPTDPCAASTAR